MTQLIKRGMVLALCLSMILSVGCGDKQGEQKNTAKGRYVEELLEFPTAERAAMLLERSDKTIDAYFFDKNNSLLLYNTKDGKQWDEKAFSWKAPENEWIVSIAYDKSDVTYVLTNSYTESEKLYGSTLYRLGDNGAAEKLDMKWKNIDSGGSGGSGGIRMSGTSASHLSILENGDMIMVQEQTGIVQYGQDGSFKHTYRDKNFKNYAISGNQIIIGDSQSSSMLVYDMITFEQQESLPFDNFTELTQMSAGQEGAVYVYNTNGVFRLAPGGSLWEKIISGEMTSFSIPSLYYGQMLEGVNNELYFICGDGSSVSKLAKYTYDKDMATLPENELIIYALEENKTLRQAAGIFQRKYPDTKINIQIAAGEGAATKSDLLKTLNTELLGGGGPDILLLDGMNAGVFIEKGILADLSDVLKEAKADKTMIKAVIDTYKNKAGTFAIPTKFELPIMAISEENKAFTKDLASIAEFSKQQELGLLGDKTPIFLMDTFLPVCAPSWIDGKNIDEEGLTYFLENMKTIYDAGAKSLTPDIPKDQMDRMTNADIKMVAQNINVFHWAFGRALSYTENFRGYDDLVGVDLAITQRGNGMIVPLPGQVSNGFIPRGTIGINSNTKQLERAEAFVAVMLSEDVQKANLYNGFAVNLAALESRAAYRDANSSFGTSNSFSQSEILSGEMPSIEAQQKLLALCKKVKTPYLANDTLMEMILEEAEGYFTGEKDISKTVADIREKTKLYLAE